MVFDSGQRFTIELRVADDDTVWRDERDPCADQATECVGLVVELGGDRCLTMGQRFGGEARLTDQRPLDAFVRRAAYRP